MITTIVAGDWWFENLMLTIRTPLGLRMAELVTFFGNTTTIIVLAGIVGIILVRSRAHWSYAAGLVVTLGGAAASGFFLKEIFMRARPGGVVQAVAETGYSFPSGHATAAMAFYGIIAFILCRLYPSYKKGIITLGAFMIAVIGFSRLYLGVHFPSDVFAGYVISGVWLLVGIAVTNRVFRLPDFAQKEA